VRRLAVLSLVCALAAAGCGGSEEVAPTVETVEGTVPAETEPAEGAQGDAAAGRPIFVSNCGACHAFEPAGTSGTAGPDLNDSEVDFEGAVQQIENGGGGMPAFKGQLSDDQIRNVAAFVVESRES
jgi:mono/diheme cytochrome c family protein